MQKNLGKSIASNLQKQTSRYLNQSRTNAFMQYLSPKSSQKYLSPFGHGQSQLQKLMNKPQLPDLTKVSSRIQQRNKKPILADIEQRIFSQIIELLEQIESLKESIITGRDQIKMFQIQYPLIEQQVRFHGYSQKLTQQQCDDLEEENLELMKHIQEYENRKINSLEEVLRIEKKKYEDLKFELNDSFSSSPKNIDEKIKKLKESITELQVNRNKRVKAEYPEFLNLKLKNQELRLKTIFNLRGATNQQEVKELQEYLQREEQNRIQFMEELKKFKNQFKRIKNQNQSLKEKLQKRYNNEAKENKRINYNSANYNTANKLLQLQSQIKKKDNSKFGEYESIIKMMQSVKK